MEVRQLEYFVAVAEEANFTRAASRVKISQSGVSAQIRQLERGLGADLIDRSTRTATLTPAGRAALDPARAVLAGLDAVRRAVDDTSNLIRGTLRVGMVTGCTITPFFHALAQLHQEHPGLVISLVEGISDHLVAEVRAGTLDAALVGIAGAVPEGLGSLTIVSEGLAAVMTAEHPLAGRARLRLAQLTRHQLVGMPEGTGVRTAFDRACAARGLTPTVVVQASAADAIADLAARDLGVGVLSASMAERYQRRLHVVPIVDADVPALLALIWTDRPHPAVAAFEQSAQDAFARPVDHPDRDRPGP
jgi:DNA-binding transcriptional LysR family regulator